MERKDKGKNFSYGGCFGDSGSFPIWELTGGALCSWGFTIPSPELLVALDPLGCENLDLSCRKALFYPCPAWPLPCPGAVRCRRVWNPPWAFSIASPRKSGSFTLFWTMQHSCPEGAGGTCELSLGSSSGGAGNCRNNFRGRYFSTGNKFALSQHPDKKSSFLTMFSAFSLFKFSRSIFF